jgi:ferredoxin
MPYVTFVNSSRTVRAGPLADLRRVAKHAGISLYNGAARFANCHGAGLCGTCRVIAEPAEALTPPTRREKMRGCTGPQRLACQARLAGDRHDVRVTKMTGFSGKGRTPVPGPGISATPRTAPVPPPAEKSAAS